MKLAGKVAIITGAARGIGKAISLRLAQEGARVALPDIDYEGALATAREVEALGGEALPLRTDVSSEAETEAMARQVYERWGRIDILVNNAAIYYGMSIRPFWELTVEEWDRMMAVNVRGVWLCAKAVFPYMREQGKGKIVNLSSGVHFAGTGPFAHYTASKGAVIALTRALAREAGRHGINVNAVAPGVVLTEATTSIWPEAVITGRAAEARSIKRTLYPEDIANAVAFLCSDDSDAITGQTLLVDLGSLFH